MKMTMLLLAATIIVTSGCVVAPVRPWERNMLAEPTMQLVPSPVDNLIDEHTYFSKEGASGGQGVGGGGCGCN